MQVDRRLGKDSAVRVSLGGYMGMNSAAGKEWARLGM